VFPVSSEGYETHQGSSHSSFCKAGCGVVVVIQVTRFNFERIGSFIRYTHFIHAADGENLLC
jgi:hypothetical protein